MQKIFLNSLKIRFFLTFTAVLSIIGCHSSSIRNSLSIFTAAGIYKTLNGSDAALLAVSTDGAQNWSYQIPTSFLPPDYQSGTTEYNYLFTSTSSCYGFICVLAGSYMNSSGGRSPLLAVSTDGGRTWTYKLSSLNVPADAGTAAQQNMSLLTASCNKDVCIASGSYYNAAGSINYPLLAVSTDAGNTWTYKITSAILPNDFNNNGTLITTSCSAVICTAAGHYQSSNNNNTVSPLLAVSTDGGNTWSYKITSLNLPSDASALPAQYGYFNQTSCSGNICTAAGQYSNSANGGSSPNSPMLAVSNDLGNTWIYKITAENVPSDGGTLATQNALFYATSCSENICTAAGEYLVPNMNSNLNSYYPMLAVSTDNGNTWTYKITSQILPIDLLSFDVQNTNYFSTTSCTQSICVAAGTYKNGDGGNSPLLAVSTDNGNTWSYKITSQNPPIYAGTATDQQVYFVQTNCSENICIAAGYYNNGNGATFPLLATSNDNGDTWVYKITAENLPVDAATSANAYSGFFTYETF